MTFGIMAIGIMTHIIKTIGILAHRMTLSITGFIAILNLTYALNVIMLTVIILNVMAHYEKSLKRKLTVFN